MVFRTELPLSPATHLLDYRHRLVTTGSCFAFNMGERLSDNKFTVSNCPFGTVYNPISTHQQLIDALHHPELPDEDFFNDQEEWKNVQFHSSFNHTNLDQLKTNITRVRENVGESLLHSHFLIITYGTAFVYELVRSGKPVANCQKLPGHYFRKRLLDPDEIVSSFEELLENLRHVQPDLNILVSLSPVRHTRDSLPLNQVSKSVLRYALHLIAEKYPNVLYFPSYEIVMDDLRDYRFYEPDLIHPNRQALDYIWEKFCDAWMSPETKMLMTKWQSVATALRHRAFAPETKANKQRLQNLLEHLTELRQLLDVENEIAEVIRQISSLK
ncbi:MAG: GSCFA domain-containing protein [Cyclobacteriaceae bacterium]